MVCFSSQQNLKKELAGQLPPQEVVDENGKWVDLPIDETEMADGEILPIPPAVPMDWLRDGLNEPAGAAPLAPLPPPAARAAPPAVMISYEQKEAAGP